MANADPFYNRKPVPDEFIQDVGPTGMTKAEELLTRERKLSRDGMDLRKFSNPKNKKGQLDPHYARKPVPDELIQDVAPTGLTAEEEFLNRERKYSVGGSDLRKFSSGKKGALEPSNDPYYNRKPVNKTQIVGVAETGYSPAEEYEIRERKQSMFQESADPFQQVTGAGHRQSISGIASGGAADARRRSSAVAPHAQVATHNVDHGAHHGAHSGFAGETLAAIESRTEQPPHSTTTTTTTTTTTSGSGVGNGTGTGLNQHGLYHDTVTRDTDDVGPTDMR